MTKKDLIDAGFALESLPSGTKCNISHKLPFIVDGVESRASKGMYSRTFYCSIDVIHHKIHKIQILA